MAFTVSGLNGGYSSIESRLGVERVSQHLNYSNSKSQIRTIQRDPEDLVGSRRVCTPGDLVVWRSSFSEGRPRSSRIVRAHRSDASARKRSRFVCQGFSRTVSNNGNMATVSPPFRSRCRRSTFVLLTPSG